MGILSLLSCPAFPTSQREEGIESKASKRIQSKTQQSRQQEGWKTQKRGGNAHLKPNWRTEIVKVYESLWLFDCQFWSVTMSRHYVCQKQNQNMHVLSIFKIHIKVE